MFNIKITFQKSNIKITFQKSNIKTGSPCRAEALLRRRSRQQEQLLYLCIHLSCRREPVLIPHRSRASARQGVTFLKVTLKETRDHLKVKCLPKRGWIYYNC
jgi:hypothetical protein